MVLQLASVYRSHFCMQLPLRASSQGMEHMLIGQEILQLEEVDI